MQGCRPCKLWAAHETKLFVFVVDTGLLLAVECQGKPGNYFGQAKSGNFVDGQRI